MNYQDITTVKVMRECPKCKEVYGIDVKAEAYVNWLTRMLIQDAFPEMSSEDRESLKTGYHSECWNSIFGEEA
jgi:hypothetical protein